MDIFPLFKIPDYDRGRQDRVSKEVINEIYKQLPDKGYVAFYSVIAGFYILARY